MKYDQPWISVGEAFPPTCHSLESAAEAPVYIAAVRRRKVASPANRYYFVRVILFKGHWMPADFYQYWGEDYTDFSKIEYLRVEYWTSDYALSGALCESVQKGAKS